MSYNCVVLVKQVPDTKKITGDVMNDDGTVKRSALPAIFNPEDLNALEMALQIKERYGGHITVITMGLPVASAILRDSLYRGADDVILITDPRCAASDTLATSYILSCAVKKLDYDIVLCGRQAIDGDTAQVGPQIAEKLDIPQVTFAESIEYLNENDIVIRRTIDNGYERIRGRLPLLITVTNTAENPRPPSIKRLMRWKKAKTKNSVKSDQEQKMLSERGLLIPVWGLEEIGCSAEICGFAGSETWIKNVENVKLISRNPKLFDSSDQGIKNLINELADDHII